MSVPSPKTVFYKKLSDDVVVENTITKTQATSIFEFFKNCPLFRWKDANNDCEDRANAICILLDSWNVPNYKGWVFSGYFLKKDYGSLINYWNYHVAAVLPVQEDDEVKFYIIDPATSATCVTLEDWANNITSYPSSFHLIKSSEFYIFPPKKIEKDNWYSRNKRNYRWTMQGLSGINGVSMIGKAYLRFNKRKVVKTETSFKKLKGAYFMNDSGLNKVN